MGIYDFSLYDLICRNARCFADRPAWFEADTGETVSFRQFKVRVDQMAAGLRQSGLLAGDRIGVLGKNSLAFFQLCGATAALGAIILPVNWRLSADEVAFNLSDGTPEMVFADDEFAPLVASVRDRIPSARRFVNLTDTGPLDAFDALMADEPFSADPFDADAG